MYFSLHYVIFTLKRIPSVRHCRISLNADRREYLIVPLILIEGFLTAKQVNKIYGWALQTFISVFPVPNTWPMFLPQGSEWTLWVFGFPVSCGDRALLCFVLYKQMSKTHLFHRQWVESWGQTHILGAAGPVNPFQDLAFQDRPFNNEGATLFWKWVED